MTEAQSPKPDLDRLSNKLKKKVSQLPSDSPGILILTIPDAWAENPKVAEPVLTAACRNLFERSQRINAVVICWVATVVTAEGGRFMAECFKVYEHPAPRNSIPDLGLINQSAVIPDWYTLLSELDVHNGCGEDVMKALQPESASFVEWYNATLQKSVRKPAA